MKIKVKKILKYCVLYLIGIHNKKFDFLIIGAQKCGTTALFKYINQHPYCIGAIGKETLLFTSFYKELMENKYFMVYFPIRTLLKKRRSLLFEATPDNIYEEAVPERIYRHNPDIKMVLLVREPVSRAISEYNMACWYAIEKKQCVREDPDHEYFEHLKQPDKYPFEWFIEEEMRKMEESGSCMPSAFHYPDFIRHGLYSDQLERYYRYFRPEQLLVLKDKDLKMNKKQTLFRIEEFLGIPHYEWNEVDLPNSNIGVYTQQISAECKQFLKQFYNPWNEKFFLMIGRKMDW